MVNISFVFAPCSSSPILDVLFAFFFFLDHPVQRSTEDPRRTQHYVATDGHTAESIAVSIEKRYYCNF